MKTPPLVEVVWHDAVVDAGAPVTVPAYKPAVRFTVGYLVYDAKDALGIAQTCDQQGEENDEMQFQDVLWIPRGMVRSRKVVRK